MSDVNFLCSGQLKICDDGAELKTVLGSCIAICIYDKHLQMGGMNHYLLPNREVARADQLGDLEFGDTSTIELIRRVKKAGSRLQDLEATVAGGASIDKANPLVGKLNLEMAESILQSFGIPVRGRSVGGNVSRKVIFKTETGEVLVQSQSPTDFVKRPHEESTALLTNLICIGASTGGTEVIRHILKQLTPPCPPILIVQHMPDQFTGMFADSLNSQCNLRVCEARQGEPLKNNTVYLAKGGMHMALGEKSGQYFIKITDDPPLNMFKPSVDYLFYSVTSTRMAPRSLAILLTGMGEDGAYGLKSLRNRGSKTLVQNESSCIVYGMPKVAMDIGAAERALAPDEIIKHIQYFTHEFRKKSA